MSRAALSLAFLALVAAAMAAPATQAAPSNPLGTKPPTALGTAGGPTTPSGVWKNDDAIELINHKGFLVHFMSKDGIHGVVGNYTSFTCLSDSSYIAVNEQVIAYANGTSVMGYHCEKGVRTADTLELTFSNGPDCMALESSTATPDATFTLAEAATGVDINTAESSNAAPDIDYTLAYALPDINIGCGTAEPGRSPGVVPPASSAARVALIGAVAAVAIALFL